MKSGTKIRQQRLLKQRARRLASHGENACCARLLALQDANGDAVVNIPCPVCLRPLEFKFKYSPRRLDEINAQVFKFALESGAICPHMPVTRPEDVPEAAPCPCGKRRFVFSLGTLIS